jgi:nitrous oxidase accessory protein NosD
VKKSVIPCVLCAFITLLLPATHEGPLASLRHVPSEQYATIQSAIDASAWGDTVLVGPGVYEETLLMLTSVSLISSDGPAKTTIDGGGQGVCLTCRQVMDSTVVIRGFTFKDGVGLHGGGVFLNTSFVTVEGNTFVGDSAKYGGGICALWSNSSIKNNTFDSNRASYGGALYTMFISPRIDSNVVENNSALIGGGIYLATSSEATVRGNLIRGNRAGRGGGVFLNTASPVLEGNTISENRAEEGGGISSLRSAGAIRQNVLWKNRGQRGAAIALGDTIAPDIERNTIAFNSASDTLCAGLYTTAVFVRVVGNIFFANSPGYAVYCDKEAAPVMSCNIMWNNETGDYLGLQSETADIYQDPLFCDAANGDFTLREGSPALGGPCGPMGALSRGCGAGPEEE